MEHAFQSTHSVGSGTRHHHPAALIPCISIHPLRGEWDEFLDWLLAWCVISIHPLRGEWDVYLRLDRHKILTFQSTHSVGSGTYCIRAAAGHSSISIHPLRGEWDSLSRRERQLFFISIHPLRGEWDLVDVLQSASTTHFNPPTPWGVGLPRGRQMPARELFQSTHSVGSGTLACLLRSLSRRISIHPLRGEWDSAKKFILDALQISIHPLRGEWDWSKCV